MPVNFKLFGKYREVRKQAFYFYNGILDKNTGSGCFGSEAVAHWARDRMFYGSNLAGDMLEFCDLI